MKVSGYSRLMSSSVCLLFLLDLVEAFSMFQPKAEDVDRQNDEQRDASHDFEALESIAAAFATVPSRMSRSPHLLTRAQGGVRNGDCQIGPDLLSCPENAEMGEGDLKSLAIALTLCSLSSAQQPIPNECSPWYQEGRGVTPFKSLRREERRDTSRCLRTIHRSPQDWTTYNTFYADAAKHCYALRGIHQLQLAYSVYANVTLQNFDFLRYQMELAKRQEEWASKLEDRLDIRFKDFTKLGDFLHLRVKDLGSLSETAMSHHQALTEWTENHILAQEKNLERFWTNMESRGDDWVGATNDVLAAGAEITIEKVTQDLLAGLKVVIDEHAQDLSEERQDYHATLKSSLSEFGDGLVSLGELQVASTSELERALSRLYLSLSQTEEAIGSLHGSVETIGNSVQKSNQRAIALQLNQEHQFLQLANFTQIQDRHINVSQQALRAAEDAIDSFRKMDHFWTSRLNVSIMSLVGFATTIFRSGSRPGVISFVRFLLYGLQFLADIMLFGCYILASGWMFVRTGLWQLISSLMKSMGFDAERLIHRQVMIEDHGDRLLLGDQQPQIKRKVPPPQERFIEFSYRSNTRQTRQVSFGRRVNDLRRRAQSEPPGI